MQQTSRWVRAVLGLIMAVVVAVGLAACGSDSESDADKSDEGTAAAKTADCTPKHEFTTIDPGVLNAVFVAYPPYGYTENGQAAGVDGEIIAEFAKEECLDLKAADADAAGIPSMVETGRADVAGGDWWRSTDRQEVVAMSDPTYVDSIAVISKEGIDTIDGLEGKTIGELQGNFWNAEAKKLFGDRYKLYRNQAQVMQDLKNGRIDVAFATPGSGAYYLEEAGMTGYQVKSLQADDRLKATTTAPQSGIMHSLENPEMTEALNALIAEMKADGRLQAIVEKYGFPPEVIDTGEPRFL